MLFPVTLVSLLLAADPTPAALIGNLRTELARDPNAPQTRKVFGFEEYRNGVRFDRHRFQAMLQPGVNTVLVKVCQSIGVPSDPDVNWEFFLRMVDPTGRGLPRQSALPPAEPK